MPSFMRRVDAGAAEAARGAPSASAAPAQEAVARKVRRGSFIFDFGLPFDQISRFADFQAEKQPPQQGSEDDTTAELELIQRAHWLTDSFTPTEHAPLQIWLKAKDWLERPLDCDDHGLLNRKN